MKLDSMSTWDEPLAAWLGHLRAAGRPLSTVNLRRYQIERLAHWSPSGPREITTAHLEAWIGRTGWSNETRRSHRAAAVLFFAWLHRTGSRADDPAAALPRVPPVRHVARPAPEQVVRAGLAADERVRLMVALAARCGLRRGEIAQVTSEAVLEGLGGWVLTVRGKGGRVRLVPIPADLAVAIRRRGQGWTFPSPAGGHLTAAHVGKLIARALPGRWSAHTLRHRFGTVAYAGSRDLLAVQALLGHAKPETTLGYCRIPDDSLRAAAAHAA